MRDILCFILYNISTKYRTIQYIQHTNRLYTTPLYTYYISLLHIQHTHIPYTIHYYTLLYYYKALTGIGLSIRSPLLSGQLRFISLLLLATILLSKEVEGNVTTIPSVLSIATEDTVSRHVTLIRCELTTSQEAIAISNKTLTFLHVSIIILLHFPFTSIVAPAQPYIYTVSRKSCISTVQNVVWFSTIHL